MAQRTQTPSRKSASLNSDSDEPLDLSDLRAVRSVVQELLSTMPKVDYAAVQWNAWTGPSSRSQKPASWPRFFGDARNAHTAARIVGQAIVTACDKPFTSNDGPTLGERCMQFHDQCTRFWVMTEVLADWRWKASGKQEIDALQDIYWLIKNNRRLISGLHSILRQHPTALVACSAAASISSDIAVVQDVLDVYQEDWTRDHRNDVVDNHEDTYEDGDAAQRKCQYIIDGFEAMVPNPDGKFPQDPMRLIHETSRKLAARCQRYSEVTGKGFQTFSKSRNLGPSELMRLANVIDEKATSMLEATATLLVVSGVQIVDRTPDDSEDPV